MKRAIRRHHVERIYNHRLRENYWGVNDRHFDETPNFPEEKKRAFFKACVNTPKWDCHHYYCKNARNWEGITRKEKESELKEQEGINEFYDNRLVYDSIEAKPVMDFIKNMKKRE